MGESEIVVEKASKMTKVLVGKVRVDMTEAKSNTHTPEPHADCSHLCQSAANHQTALPPELRSAPDLLRLRSLISIYYVSKKIQAALPFYQLLYGGTSVQL